MARHGRSYLREVSRTAVVTVRTLFRSPALQDPIATVNGINPESAIELTPVVHWFHPTAPPPQASAPASTPAPARPTSLVSPSNHGEYQSINENQGVGGEYIIRDNAGEELVFDTHGVSENPSVDESRGVNEHHNVEEYHGVNGYSTAEEHLSVEEHPDVEEHNTFNELYGIGAQFDTVAVDNNIIHEQSIADEDLNISEHPNLDEYHTVDESHGIEAGLGVETVDDYDNIRPPSIAAEYLDINDITPDGRYTWDEAQRVLTYYDFSENRPSVESSVRATVTTEATDDNQSSNDNQSVIDLYGAEEDKTWEETFQDHYSTTATVGVEPIDNNQDISQNQGETSNIRASAESIDNNHLATDTATTNRDSLQSGNSNFSFRPGDESQFNSGNIETPSDPSDSSYNGNLQDYLRDSSTFSSIPGDESQFNSGNISAPSDPPNNPYDSHPQHSPRDSLQSRNTTFSFTPGDESQFNSGSTDALPETSDSSHTSDPQYPSQDPIESVPDHDQQAQESSTVGNIESQGITLSRTSSENITTDSITIGSITIPRDTTFRDLDRGAVVQHIHGVIQNHVTNALSGGSGIAIQTISISSTSLGNVIIRDITITGVTVQNLSNLIDTGNIRASLDNCIRRRRNGVQFNREEVARELDEMETQNNSNRNCPGGRATCKPPSNPGFKRDDDPDDSAPAASLVSSTTSVATPVPVSRNSKFSSRDFRLSQQIFPEVKNAAITINAAIDLEVSIPTVIPAELQDIKMKIDQRVHHSMIRYTKQKKLPPTPPTYHFLLTLLFFKWLTPYKLLYASAFLGNLAAFLALLVPDHTWADYSAVDISATAVAINVTILILIRQDWFINFGYWATRQIPVYAPLRIRIWAASFYENGGIHTGCATAATLWFIFFTFTYSFQYDKGFVSYKSVLVLTTFIIVLFFSIIITALPFLRAKNHNVFEYTHRYGGWALLVFFWPHLILLLHESALKRGTTLGKTIIYQPGFWLLLASTLMTIYPWLLLRRVRAHANRLSNHAIQLCFYEPIHLFKGVGLANTRLGETHSFASIPNRDRTGFSVIISAAGDWTKKTIGGPQQHYWLRGIPKTGVLCIAPLFKSILVVATGSGIGPCLGVIQDIPDCRVHLVWYTKLPFQTFGADICSKVLAVDENAIITDSSIRGPTGEKIKIDPFLIAYNAYLERGKPEAVLVISNKETTTDTVFRFRSLGIVCFGPIWDS